LIGKPITEHFEEGDILIGDYIRRIISLLMIDIYSLLSIWKKQTLFHI
jgi:hypothetical protein